MQRLERPLGIVHSVWIAEAAGQQEIGELRDQILEIQFVELIASELGVSVLHDTWA